MYKIKDLLAKYPRLDKAVRRVYLPVATRFTYFRSYLRRNRLSDGWLKEGSGLIEESFKTVNHPHRPLLVERIAAFSPVTSVLEVGCWTGVNVYLLSRRFPQARLEGIDVNAAAVREGNDWLVREGMINARLSLGRAEELQKFADKSFDVVFSDAVLIYVSRSQIHGVIEQMARIARKGLVLVEWHDFQNEDRDGLGVFTKGYWVRDYTKLLKQVGAEEQINISKFTDEVYPGSRDGWATYGAILAAKLKKDVLR